MKKTIAMLGLLAAAGLGTVACSGSASADEGQTVIVNQSNSSTSDSTSCIPADVAARFPWLAAAAPVCP